MYEAMRELGIPQKLIRMVRMTLDKTTNVVTVEGDLTEEFGVGRGLRQRDVLSTVLFNLVLERAFRRAEVDRNGVILNRMVQCLAYADDIDIVAR